ncbi:alpha/beta hydrolase [Sphingobacterium psychroaquaticum]|uniref:alpha/beta hydrolase n=1 Tax=Sphingobacterium psychroaquaticum TaxID=561061 RepID=UPI00106A2131|nr:alpha/beta hydrolase [Sphingobacterium psychroaquaticum]QBQ42601.1 alpha/beta hydrolase [Sphingobacterium psychroaquaticum]
MKRLFSFLCFVTMSYYLLAQEKIVLYPTEIPNSKQDVSSLSEEDTPVLYKYDGIVSKKAVLIIPGGGYARVALQHEGHDVAKAFNAHGYNAFVLYYRLPKDATMVDRKYGPLQDAQRAMQFIRTHYELEEVGVLGFSAGGHLAATLSTHFDDVKIENIKQIPLRPDFSVLVYPVISMEDAYTHKGSKNNLLGAQPAAADITYFSLDKQVNKGTPPTFLVHAKDDKAVAFENAMLYQEGLRRSGVKNDVFIYDTGGHGFGLNNATDSRKWADAMFEWLEKVDSE